jgi:hypothetical protein
MSKHFGVEINKTIFGDKHHELVITHTWQPERKSKVQLLRLSIEKWQAIADYDKEHPNHELNDGGPGTCPCCQKYWGNGEKCRGCPIKMFAKEAFCENTPYPVYAHHPGSYDAAMNEVKFLKKVLAKEIAKEKAKNALPKL